MKTILAATLIVRVLGLATVTDQVPNDCGTHVIVPRVDFHSHVGQQQQAPQVEDHTAMLVVHKDYYDPSSTWKMSKLPAFPSYMYVALDGDQVRVVGNITSTAPVPSGLLLPSLKGCCSSGIKGLNTAFQAPYTGAAAVLDVPRGKVQACSTRISAKDWRYDTEIQMDYTGAVKISGDTMKEQKEIRLKALPTSLGSAGVVYLANLPTCFLTNSCKPKLTTDADALSHVHAYYQMLEGVTSSCTSTMTKCKLPTTIPTSCKSPMIHNSAGVGSPQAFGFECSNTKYP